jgi:hypothetical protein
MKVKLFLAIAAVIAVLYGIAFLLNLKLAARRKTGAPACPPKWLTTESIRPGDEQRHQDRGELGDERRRGEAGRWRR